MKPLGRLCCITNEPKISGLFSFYISSLPQASCSSDAVPHGTGTASDWNIASATVEGIEDMVNYWLALKAVAYMSLAEVNHTVKFDIGDN